MVGFAKATANTTIAKGKAYLEVNDPSNSREFYSIDGSTTGINGITNATQTDNSIYFSISGMETTKPQKGIYIHCGKKVVLK